MLQVRTRAEDRRSTAVRMTDRAYRALRKSIIDLEIEPGAQLDLDEIGQSFGFSRAPVVEALNMLRAEGLVTSKRRVGTFAAPISRQRIIEAFEAREMLEYWTVPVVIDNVSNRQLDELEGLVDEAGPLLDVEAEGAFDYGRFMELDQAFHIGIVRLAERQMLLKWFDELTAHMQRVRNIFVGNSLARSREGQVEHGAILSALRERNVEAAREALRLHTRKSFANAMEILASRPDQPEQDEMKYG